MTEENHRMWFSSQALTPEQQIKALQVELQQANEKARLLEEMLDVLKQDYGVRVVKNLWASPRAKSRPCCIDPATCNRLAGWSKSPWPSAATSGPTCP
ncbi:MAG: hypothetical protein EPN35_00930 [Rhodanobacter sp.]|nr:MAG: hypothetical protein EPN35_00930 [Rhodanobacter sp.]